ncbi:N-acetylmuramoyl-L-alanine amidase [Dongia sp.]|uniref:N-acetylmuramoyl-L-alanine amidase family protein n=1 Tax=Dongia sp. TaxID=1977262 RepID=UPI0035B32BAE
MATIVIDPGHGGTQEVGGSSPNNATGPTGLLEKDVTLQVGRRVADILGANGHAVVLTRTKDVNVGLSARARVSMDNDADVFVSIHFNGFNHQAQGTETICDPDHTANSANLCRRVQASLVAATGLADRNADEPNGVKVQPLSVLKRVKHPSRTGCCLTEISFMDVATEEARLKNPAYLESIATAIAGGIRSYLN